jgi:hypothetical protein
MNIWRTKIFPVFLHTFIHSQNPWSASSRLLSSVDQTLELCFNILIGFSANSFRNPAARLPYNRCIGEIAVRVGFSVRNIGLRESVESLVGGFGGRIAMAAEFEESVEERKARLRALRAAAELSIAAEEDGASNGAVDGNGHQQEAGEDT